MDEENWEWLIAWLLKTRTIIQDWGAFFQMLLFITKWVCAHYSLLGICAISLPSNMSISSNQTNINSVNTLCPPPLCSRHHWPNRHPTVLQTLPSPLSLVSQEQSSPGQHPQLLTWLESHRLLLTSLLGLSSMLVRAARWPTPWQTPAGTPTPHASSLSPSSQVS